MNEALNAVQAADGYTDALTLGPLPATNVDGADVTIQGAAVLAQVFRKSLQGEQAQDDREYLFLPGSRHLANIAGLRFRNAVAGIPAIVTASLTGPDIPLIGPIFGDIPIVGAPLLLPQQVPLDAGGNAVNFFSGVPPTGYSGLLVMVDTGTAGPVWMRVGATVPGFVNTRQNIYLPAVTRSFFVLNLPAATVGVDFVAGNPNHNQMQLGVWPTNLPPGTYLPPTLTNVANPVLYHADGLSVANGVTFVDMAQPYFGPAKINGAAGPFTGGTVQVLINLLDQTGARIGFEGANQQTAFGTETDVFLVPGRHQIEWINTTGAAQTTSLSIIGQYSGWTP